MGKKQDDYTWKKVITSENLRRSQDNTTDLSGLAFESLHMESMNKLKLYFYISPMMEPIQG